MQLLLSCFGGTGICKFIRRNKKYLKLPYNCNNFLGEDPETPI